MTQESTETLLKKPKGNCDSFNCRGARRQRRKYFHAIGRANKPFNPSPLRAYPTRLDSLQHYVNEMRIKLGGLDVNIGSKEAPVISRIRPIPAHGNAHPGPGTRSIITIHRAIAANIVRQKNRAAAGRYVWPA